MEPISMETGRTNMSSLDRSVSIAGGIALAAAGLRTKNKMRVPMALIGGELLRRGITGHCYLYDSLGLGRNSDSTRNALSGRGGITVDESITIRQPVSSVYRFWRDLENLPRIMTHLKDVQILDSKRSHWIARGPAGATVEWDAEIINEEEDRLIGWKSVGDQDVYTAGSVRFFDRGGRGTEVRVRLQYQPPAGKLGALAASILGEEPSQQIREDLGRLKYTLENGEAVGF